MESKRISGDLHYCQYLLHHVTILDPEVATLFSRIEGKATEFCLLWLSKDKQILEML
jgi:hypothetical protein